MFTKRDGNLTSLFQCGEESTLVPRTFIEMIASTLSLALMSHTHTHTHTHAQNGFFPLYAASEMGRDEIIEMLVQAGAVVNLQSKVEYCYLVQKLFCY